MLTLIIELFDAETGEKIQLPVIITLKENHQNNLYFEVWLSGNRRFIFDKNSVEKMCGTVLTPAKLRKIKNGYVL